MWREAASANGLAPEKYHALRIGFSTWQSIVLFILKTLIHWVFSLAFGIYYEGIELRIPQVCYTAITLFMLSVLATWLALWRPAGPQPATFGHLPTLVDLIDVWPCRMTGEVELGQGVQKNTTEDAHGAKIVTLYWGDKGINEDGTRRAGTAFERLQPLVMSAVYM